MTGYVSMPLQEEWKTQTHSRKEHLKLRDNGRICKPRGKTQVGSTLPTLPS